MKLCPLWHLPEGKMKKKRTKMTREHQYRTIAKTPVTLGERLLHLWPGEECRQLLCLGTYYIAYCIRIIEVYSLVSEKTLGLVL